MEVMLHRRLLQDDHHGVGEALNETGPNGLGLVIRCKHWMTLDFADNSVNLRRSLAERLSNPLVWLLLCFVLFCLCSSFYSAARFLLFVSSFLPSSLCSFPPLPLLARCLHMFHLTAPIGPGFKLSCQLTFTCRPFRPFLRAPSSFCFD
jgi:hypothetical protein